MTETAKIIVSFLSAAIPLILFVLGLIVKFVKNTKAKNVAEKLNFWLKQIQKYIPVAEKLLDANGEEKKEFVLANINKACHKNNIAYDEDLIGSLIDKTVKLTKQVNQRPKDKINASGKIKFKDSIPTEAEIEEVAIALADEKESKNEAEASSASVNSEIKVEGENK